MKYVFIINPAAGPSNPYDRLGDQIKSVCESKQLDYELLFTERAGHATELAAAVAAAATADEPVRIFSVGGDGTLGEISTALINKPFCELGCLPCGSGNDYIKAFGGADGFLDLEHYITAPSVRVDGIKAGDHYSINICSLGFDAKICDCANRIKAKNKRLSGPKAYDKAVARCFFGRLYNNLTVTIDGDAAKTYKGKYLFTIAASGTTYGGGYKAAPMADPTDGVLEFIMIKTVSHLRVPMLIGAYKAGTYPEKRSFKRLLIHTRGSSVRIQSKKPAVLNVDGECFPISDITLELVPSALSFIVPKAYADSASRA